MKKIMLSLALLGCTLAAQAEGYFHLTKKDGGEKGFDYIKQHTDTQGNTEMSCSKPGAMPAEFMSLPDTPDKTDYNKIIRHIDKAITNGKRSGSETIEGREVRWKGADVNNYELMVAAR